MTLQTLAELCANQKLRFLAVGGWNTLFGYLVFCAFHLTVEAKWGVMATLVASYLVALPQSFMAQRLLVFRTGKHWAPEFARFIVSNSSIFAANLILLPLAKAATDANTALLQAIFLAVSTVASYLVHKHFTFSR